MSLLGASFDAFLVSIAMIVDFFIQAVLGLIGIVVSVLASIGHMLSILNYMFGFLEFFIGVILNPYLMALFLIASSFYYAAFTARTRKDLMKQVAIYWKYVFEAIIKIAQATYTIVYKIIVGIIDML
jgi:hypothetical protein